MPSRAERTCSDNVCAACHQADAKGAVGAGAYPPLAADTDLASADFMLACVLGGLKGMPPVGGMMSDAQVADVVNYVRTHFGNAYPDAVSAADVAAARRRTARRDRRAFGSTDIITQNRIVL